MRGALGVGRGDQIGEWVVAEIEPRTFDRCIHHRETLYPFLAQGGVKLRLGSEMAPAERTMQAAKQTNQYRTVTAKVIECDFAVACDRIQHNVRCAVARVE